MIESVWWFFIGMAVLDEFQSQTQNKLSPDLRFWTCQLPIHTLSDLAACIKPNSVTLKTWFHGIKGLKKRLEYLLSVIFTDAHALVFNADLELCNVFSFSKDVFNWDKNFNLSVLVRKFKSVRY